MSTVRTSAAHAADRLVAAIERLAAPVCVGINPVIERLPKPLQLGATPDPSLVLDRFRTFTLGILDAVGPHVPCIKLQSACFERYGANGVALIFELIGAAKSRGFEVILDAKRGDIGISADHYAAAVFAGSGPHADWVTVNAYLGEDGIRPFLAEGGAAFALVRTSNSGGDLIQGQPLADGRSVAECVADLVAAIGRLHVGECGYSTLGAVVGATKADDAFALRERMPQQVLLIPGYGAQGGDADDVRSCFHPGGRGAIVTSSRSVIFASAESDWQDAAAEAAERLADEVGRVSGAR